MKLGVFILLFVNLLLDEMLDKVKVVGFDVVEIGMGGNFGNYYCLIDEFLVSEVVWKEYLDKFIS